MHILVTLVDQKGWGRLIALIAPMLHHWLTWSDNINTCLYCQVSKHASRIIQQFLRTRSNIEIL